MLMNDQKSESASQDSPNELFIVEGLFFFHFELLKELVELVVRQFFPQVCHHISKLFDCDCGPLGLEDGLHGFN